jgi:hypothetical protein
MGTIQPSTDCEKVWGLANRWIDACEEMHADCATPHETKTLPTRLLDIGSNNDEIRLVTTESLPVHTQYATLSHCWGSKSFMTLTSHTFADFLVHVPFERLSKT